MSGAQDAENNIDPEVALVPDRPLFMAVERAAVAQYLNTIVRTLKQWPRMKPCSSSRRAVGVMRTFKHSPRVLIANLILFGLVLRKILMLRSLGLQCMANLPAAGFILHAGILQGTYETFAAIADKLFEEFAGKWVVTVVGG